MLKMKNDKLIVILGAVILVIASIGIYYWVPEETRVSTIEIEDIVGVSGVFSNIPDAVTVSDCNPFYALIATPLAVHCNNDNYQEVIPLYVQNFNEPSSAIDRAEEQIGIYSNEVIRGLKSAKEISLELAEKYWESSEGVLLIEDIQSGYNLGVLATPLASYLSIPVIVTDEMDADVRAVLEDLGVRCSIVCGDIEGFGDVLRFNNVDDIVNASIEIVREKFGEVNYITVTNPIDAREPEVLDKTAVSFKGRVTGGSILPSQIGSIIRNIASIAGTHLGTFTIPDDYKYALVKFDGRAEYKDPENPDEFGSSVGFTVSGPTSIFGRGLDTNAGGISIRDANGNLVTDRVYTENVLYDMGGEEFSVSGRATLFVTDSADVTVNIVIEKLSDPVYPMMKGLSSLAPYLTAYHKGIVFGEPEFAFTADDAARTERDETCPGPYQPRINHKLVYPSNKHVIWIHDQINELLAKLADIDIDELGALENLRNYYKSSPVYIALVGGNVVLPQIIYDNYITPPDPNNYVSINYGIGTPSDVIYGNIDPLPNDFSNTAEDVYTEFPYQENIVGRITGWDAQDASALIARTIFYNNIIEKLGDWKDKATVQTGCGTDFLKPRIALFIKGLAGGSITGIAEPVKWPSGCTDIIGDRLQKKVLEPLGFDVYRTKHTASQVAGFSDEAIETIRKANLLSRILFAPRIVKLVSGEKHVKGGELMEECNMIWQYAHGNPNMYVAGDICASTLGWRFFPLLLNYAGRTLGYIVNTRMSQHGTYSTRSVEQLELGPSVMATYSCFGAKIDGMYPKSCISQAILHAGANAFISGTTTTNCPGGYLEPYGPGRYNIRGFIATVLNAKKGIYPEPTFGGRIFTDFYDAIGEDQDVGTALRNARNAYLPQDINSTFRWVPPLNSNYFSGCIFLKTTAGSHEGETQNFPRHKYMSYYEYTLFGDPAFNPYEPINEGR